MVLQVGAVDTSSPTLWPKTATRSRVSSGPDARRSPRAPSAGRHAPRRGRGRAFAPAGPRRARLAARSDRPRRAARRSARRDPFPLPRGVELSAYRIVQEGLTNALKHAHASDADVTARYRPDELEIEVRDDSEG